MRSFLRSLKHLPLAAAVVLTTHPALAFNLGNSRLSGGSREFFEPFINFIKKITDGLVYTGGTLLALSAVFLIYQIAISSRFDPVRIVIIVGCGAALLAIDHLPSLFGAG